jgi:tryptophanyl-tRNA synthetase
MSASKAETAVYITDTPAQIKNKIKKYAFSGGGDTAEVSHPFLLLRDIHVVFSRN